MTNLIVTEQDRLYLAQILKLKENHQNSWGIMLNSSKNKHLKDWLNSKTPLLQDKKYTFLTKLYWVKNNLSDFPCCIYSENGKCELGFDVKQYGNVVNLDLGYNKACSLKCPKMLKIKQEKIESTILKKYGSTNFFLSEEGKKRKQDWCEKNGVTNAFQLENIKEKSKQTRKENFGYEYTMQSPEKRKQISEAYFKKTGFQHQFLDPKTKEKSLKTLQAKKDSGIDVYAIRKANNRKHRYRKFLENEEIQPNFSEEDFLKLDAFTQYTTPLSWHCKKCNCDFEATIDQNFSSRNDIPVRCLNCHPLINNGISNAENEIYQFISDHVENIVKNDRSILNPLELDIYIPEKKLAIEFDGLYWHSDEARVDKSYHLNKTLECEKQGIQLIHIFENEWLTKQDIVKSRLKNLLGVYDKVVYARKCEIKEVDSKTSKEFQQANHIQGAVNSKVNLGLYYQDELISLMTFTKCRFDKKHEWELLRFCNKLGYHIPGSASKLLSYFENTYKPTSLVSYADRRWSQGKVYKKLGFTFSHASAPNYWYWKNIEHLQSRVQFQKHKLKDILENFDESKTEVENMKANGYNRIFDCGNLVYEKIYNSTI